MASKVTPSHKGGDSVVRELGVGESRRRYYGSPRSLQRSRREQGREEGGLKIPFTLGWTEHLRESSESEGLRTS